MAGRTIPSQLYQDSDDLAAITSGLDKKGDFLSWEVELYLKDSLTNNLKSKLFLETPYQ